MTQTSRTPNLADMEWVDMYDPTGPMMRPASDAPTPQKITVDSTPTKNSRAVARLVGNCSVAFMNFVNNTKFFPAKDVVPNRESASGHGEIRYISDYF